MFHIQWFFWSVLFIVSSCSSPPASSRKQEGDASSSEAVFTEKQCITDNCEKQKTKQQQAEQASGMDVRKSLLEKPVDKAQQIISSQINGGAWFQKTSEGPTVRPWPDRNLFFLCNNSLSLVSFYKKDDQKFSATFEKIASHLYRAAASVDATNKLDVFYYDTEKKLIQYQTKFKSDKSFSEPKTVDVSVSLSFFPDVTAGITKEGFPILYVLMRNFDPNGKEKPVKDTSKILKFSFDESRAYTKNEESSTDPFDTSKAKHTAFFKERNTELFDVADQSKAEEVIKAYSFDWEETAQEAFHAEVCPPSGEE